MKAGEASARTVVDRWSSTCIASRGNLESRDRRRPPVAAGRPVAGVPMIGRVRTSAGIVAAVIATVSNLTALPSASATPPPYVTVLFSRSQWSVHEGCNVLPGAITLERIAADLEGRGWIGTGSVVTSRIRETSVNCTRAALYPSWALLERLHADYGWEATSHSATYPNMTLLSRDRQIAESCGTLPTFRDHGFDRAWGLFSYPNNKRSTEIQTEVVSTCFTFGRRYSPDRNAIGRMAPPWWAKIRSVNGGRCNDDTAACSTIVSDYRYANPSTVAALFGVLPGQWAIAQFHKLVSGSKLSGTVRWDCTASDWRLHFTSRVELYCWNDYQRILNAIPDGAVVTDPVTVARSWHSNPPVLQLHQ
jgi:hypothetical protein